MMKNILLIGLIVSGGLFITSCHKHHPAPAKTGGFNGSWKVVQYEDLVSNQTFTRSSHESGMEDFKGKNVIVTMEQQGDSIQLRGHTISNEVVGLLKLKNSDSIKCLSIGGTSNSEPRWGSWFMDAIFSAQTYKLYKDTIFIDYNFQDYKKGSWRVILSRE